MESEKNWIGIIVAIFALGIFLFRIYTRMQKAKQEPSKKQKSVTDSYEPYKDGPAEISDEADD